MFRFCLILALLLLAGCGSASTPSPSPTGNVLKVGTDATFAPFEFMNEKERPMGFDIDLINALGKDMGYQVDLESASFDGLLPALQGGKYDAVISAMTITPDRAKSILFSDRYFRSIQYIAMKKGSSIKTLEGLKGEKVGVELYTTGEFDVEQKGITPRKYETTPDALNDLVDGSLNAVVADGPAVLWFQAQNPNVQIDSEEADVPEEYYGIAMRSGNKYLADKINASLKKLIDSGGYNNIYKKWFKRDAPKL